MQPPVAIVAVCACNKADTHTNGQWQSVLFFLNAACCCSGDEGGWARSSVGGLSSNNIQRVLSHTQPDVDYELPSNSSYAGIYFYTHTHTHSPPPPSCFSRVMCKQTKRKSRWFVTYTSAFCRWRWCERVQRPRPMALIDRPNELSWLSLFHSLMSGHCFDFFYYFARRRRKTKGDAKWIRVDLTSYWHVTIAYAFVYTPPPPPIPTPSFFYNIRLE